MQATAIKVEKIIKFLEFLQGRQEFPDKRAMLAEAREIIRSTQREREKVEEVRGRLDLQLERGRGLEMRIEELEGRLENVKAELRAMSEAVEARRVERERAYGRVGYLERKLEAVRKAVE